MLEAYGNIWDLVKDYDAVVITTNGSVNSKGEAIIGSGIALEAREKFPGFAKSLGERLKNWGNHVYVFSNPEYLIITMPTKPEWGPDGKPGWQSNSNYALIEQSIKELVDIVDHNSIIKKVIMPRPGVGAGKLPWAEVKKLIEPLLDDRFTVVTHGPK